MDGGGPRCECPPPYLFSLHGILKIAEMVLTILTFACSFGAIWYKGDGWVEFAGISAFVTITVWFILHLINLIPQIIVNFVIEIVGYIVMTVFLLIAGIVAAVGANARGNGSAGAASFFAFASAIVCGIDAILQILARRQGMAQSSQQTTTSTTTTTTTTAAKVEY